MKFLGINNIEESILNDKDTKEEITVEDCEEAIIEIGSNGRFQTMALFLLLISFTCSGATFINCFVFFLKDLQFECFIDNSWESCNRDTACAEGMNYRFEYSPNPNFSWINDFKLDCTNSYTIYLFQVLFIVSTMISSLFASWISDFVGRIKLVNISMIGRTILLLIPLIFPYQVITMFSLILLGAIGAFHTNVSYILISEYVSRFEKDRYQTFLFAGGSFLSVLAALYFFLYQNWRIFFMLNLLYGVIFCIFSFKLLESPRFLVSKYKFDQAREVLRKIANINGTKRNLNFKFEKEDKLAQNDRKKIASIYLDKNSALDTTIPSRSLFISKKFKYYSIALPMLFLTSSLNHSGLDYHLKFYSGNMYLLVALLYVAETITLIISYFLMHYLGKKYSLFVMLVVSMVSQMSFFFSDREDIHSVVVLTFLTMLGYAGSVNIVYSYANEYYPTDLRGRAMAICIFADKLGRFAGPFLSNFEEYILVVSASFSLISFFFLCPFENNFTNTYLVDNSEDVNQE